MQLQRCGIKRASGPQLPARRGPTPRHRHFRAHAGPEGANVETLTVPSGRTERRNDPFVDAAYRIHGLLHAVGDGEDELMQQSLREEAPLSKLGLMAVGGGSITVAALLVCSLAGVDPWGGASLSWHSLASAAIGGALALPLVWFREYTWSADAVDALPALGDMHKQMADEAEPWLCCFDAPHLAAHAALEVLPLTLLLLPAAQGGLCAAFSFYSDLLQRALFAAPPVAAAPAAAAAAAAADAAGGAAAAAATPEGLGALLAVVVTGAAAGVVQSLNLVTPEEEVDILRDAVHSADRYYRLTSVGVSNTAAHAERAAVAFKAVAVSWMEAREDASSLAGSMAFIDVASVSAIWYMTGDLAAAMTAALAVSAVDYYHLWQAARRGGARRGARGKAAESRGGESQ